MQKFMEAAQAVAKLKDYTGITDDAELARKLAISATAIKIFSGPYSKTRAYTNLVQNAKKQLGLSEEFFFEDKDPIWTPAKPAVKVEISGSKAVSAVVVKEDDPFGDEASAPSPVPTPAAAAKDTIPKPASAPAVNASDYQNFADKAVEMLRAGMSRKDVLNTLGVGKTTFYKYLKLAGVDINKITAEKNAALKGSVAAPAVKEAPAAEPETVTEAPAPVAEEPAEPETPAETPVAEAVTEPAAEPVAEEPAVEAPAVTLAEAVTDKAPEETAAPADAGSFADVFAKKIAADITDAVQAAIDQATKGAEERKAKLEKLVAVAAGLPDDVLDAMLCVFGNTAK